MLSFTDQDFTVTREGSLEYLRWSEITDAAWVREMIRIIIHSPDSRRSRTLFVNGQDSSQFFEWEKRLASIRAIRRESAA